MNARTTFKSVPGSSPLLAAFAVSGCAKLEVSAGDDDECDLIIIEPLRVKFIPHGRAHRKFREAKAT